MAEPPVCAVDRPFSEAEVGETAGVTSQLPPPSASLVQDYITWQRRRGQATETVSRKRTRAALSPGILGFLDALFISASCRNFRCCKYSN